jgi:outer membrane protein assembly factor BamB
VAITGLALCATSAAAAPASPAAARSTTAASGTKLWEALFTGAGRGAFGSGAAVSPDGTVVFAAGAADKRVREAGGTADEATVLAYHAGTGTVLWRASYNPSQRSSSVFDALAVSPDGSTVFATGGAAPATGKPQSAVTVAYKAATGAPIWTNASAAAGPDSSIAVSPDGSTVFVTTGANSSGGGAGPDIVALNAATGTVRWTAKPGTGSADQVVMSPDGSTVFILGYNENFIPIVAARDAATGAVRWTDTVAQFTPTSIAVSPDASKVAVTGLEFGASGNILRTVAYGAATGAALWSKQYKGPNGSSDGYAVTFSPDSATIYVAGATREAGANNLYYVAVLAYHAATGASVWQSTLPAFSLGTTWTDQIAVSPDGSRVFVTGVGSASSPLAFSTAALDAATGAKLWALGHEVHGNHWRSFSESIVVSPDGTRVFVSGTLNSPTPNQNGSMATVAYSS